MHIFYTEVGVYMLLSTVYCDNALHALFFEDVFSRKRVVWSEVLVL